jgi:anti-sigma factor RsiW
MNCELYDDLIDDYVDGIRAANSGNDGRMAAFERHLAECGRCQAVVADLTSIRTGASSLERHVPPPRLWTAIARSLDEQQRQPWWQRQLGGAFSLWVPVAAAASIALLLVSGLWQPWKQAAQESHHQDVSALSPESAPVPAEQHYEQAIAGLQQLADAQNAALDPATRTVLTQNLAVIDRAINESRAALAQEPASTLAQESLLDALETKVTLLQDTVALASETGAMADDPAGTAKELNQ